MNKGGLNHLNLYIILVLCIYIVQERFKDIFNQYFFFSIFYHFEWLVSEKKLIFFRQIKVINN